MKKKFILTTIALPLLACTATYRPSAIELWAMDKAKTYPRNAQISYLQCAFTWPDKHCIEKNLDIYGIPEITSNSLEDKKAKALAFVHSMEMLGAAEILHDNGYPCKSIISMDNMIFSNKRTVMCDEGQKVYKIKLARNIWQIEKVTMP